MDTGALAAALKNYTSLGATASSVLQISWETKVNHDSDDSIRVHVKQG